MRYRISLQKLKKALRRLSGAPRRLVAIIYQNKVVSQVFLDLRILDLLSS